MQVRTDVFGTVGENLNSTLLKGRRKCSNIALKNWHLHLHHTSVESCCMHLQDEDRRPITVFPKACLLTALPKQAAAQTCGVEIVWGHSVMQHLRPAPYLYANRKSACCRSCCKLTIAIFLLGHTTRSQQVTDILIDSLLY